MYEVQRASKPEGPFLSISNPLPQLTIFSDYLGETNQPVFYRIRSVRGTNENEEHSAWSNVLKSHPLPFDPEKLLTEVQEAGFRYFYDFGHPVSGLARVSVVKGPDLCEI